MLTQFILLILLPIFFLVSLWRSRANSRVEWLVALLAAGSYLLFVFVTGRWDFFSYYLRFLLVPAFILSGYAAFRRISRVASPPKTNKRIGLFINLFLLVALSWLNISAIGGYFCPNEPIALAHPLRDGVYYVGGGGNTRWINNHQAHNSQKFALDILGLNKLGNRANAFEPTELEQYVIFGSIVYSPCAGEVVKAVDGLPDLIPPNRDTVNIAGNHVVIFCHNAKILIAHLRRDSVKLKVGDAVSVGEIVGNVGNSGNTMQPHLHIHAERGGTRDSILDGEGIPIIFGGRFLVRNSLFTGSD